jgi:L-alanine-DL-glutamate epimerase-like enolase superfamily enzyme
MIDGLSLERREVGVSSGWTRVTTTVVLDGLGEAGAGEDVTYQAADHDGFPRLDLVGSYPLWKLSRLLDGEEIGGGDYRRWAFESAALDLALRQSGLSLARALGRETRSVRFVISTRSGIDEWLALYPGLELKVDAEKSWDGPAMARLASTGAVRTVDLKAYYDGDFADFPREPERYRLVAAAFEEAVLEDAWLGDGCLEALAGAEGRLSFDAPIHSLDDLEALPLEPGWLNVKPSRFGTVQRLLECVEACERRGIRMYGGGQFELGPGRRQIQTLASVLYPGGPNDVAPGVYNEGGPREGLPRSPLPLLEHVGF